MSEAEGTGQGGFDELAERRKKIGQTAIDDNIKALSTNRIP